MKYEIETYKGQLIEYDEELDKFICDISTEDKFKSTKRSSLKDVKREIDTFIKLNLDFKPFKALMINEYDKDDFKVVHFESIRTDGKFVGKTDGVYKNHYNKKDMANAMVYDTDIVNRKALLVEKKEKALKEYRASIKELCKNLIPVDLSKYEYILNPEP